jgi:3-phenylpropionate/cinnamic acid dioxygenase small subunit
MRCDASPADVLREVEQFLYREARFADDHDYDAWEALWDDDGVYWIPANGDEGDPEQVMSILYDNRSRIALRIKQLHTGRRHSQTPQSRLRRLISNVEILEQSGTELRAACNTVVYESNLRGEQVWPSRNEFLLRRSTNGIRMAFKKVRLVHNDKALYSMSFLV